MIFEGFPDDVSIPLAPPPPHALNDDDNHEDTNASAGKLCSRRDVPGRRQEAGANRLPVAPGRSWISARGQGCEGRLRTHNIDIEQLPDDMSVPSMSIPDMLMDILLMLLV